MIIFSHSGLDNTWPVSLFFWCSLNVALRKQSSNLEKLINLPYMCFKVVSCKMLMDVALVRSGKQHMIYVVKCLTFIPATALT